MSRFYAYANATCGYSGREILGGRRTVIDGQDAVINGTSVFYLSGLEGPDGLPTPGTQLEVLRKEEKGAETVTITETVGTGWQQTGGTPRRVNKGGRWMTIREGGVWSLKREVASRTYAYRYDADKETKEGAKATARWFDKQGREVRVWCKLVREDAARAAGFKLPKRHLGNNRWEGRRDVGVEHSSVPQGQARASAVATVAAKTVEVATAEQAGPNAAEIEWRE